MKLVLGIECTAHTFGIGIISIGNDSKEVLFNEKNVYHDEHNGMDPRKLSEFHINNFEIIVTKAKEFLQSMKKDFSDISLLTFSQGPGQGNSLKVAGLVAKTLAQKYSIPIVGVNHIRSHLEIGKMHTGFKDPLFLNITGVNSQAVASRERVESDGVCGCERECFCPSNYAVYGETEDIGLGNFLDSIGRLFDLGFPGGPVIDKLATEGKTMLEIPYTIKGMNVSFAGTISNIKQKKEAFENKKSIKTISGDEILYDNYEIFLRDLCYSIIETSFAMILEVAERALAYTQKKELVLVGGVASSKRFVEMTKGMCKLRKVSYEALPLSLCMDNGAMIAWAGYVRWQEKGKPNPVNLSNLKPMPYITVENNI